jgi:hypothetical protein
MIHDVQSVIFRGGYLEWFLEKATSYSELWFLVQWRPTARPQLIERDTRLRDEQMRAAYILYYRTTVTALHRLHPGPELGIAGDTCPFNYRSILPDCYNCGKATGAWCDYCSRIFCKECEEHTVLCKHCTGSPFQSEYGQSRVLCAKAM